MSDVPGAPPSSSLDRAGPATPYRVLARKYRPSRFDDLIGQEAMVRTLSNAFDLNRIHQAYLLCGVRGVGKTTTARIMARALNYHRAATATGVAIDAPTIAMPDLGTHCQAIIESRHVDVIEMDAASHTGIDDIRELIDGARYRPVMARHKVYIIDEVHMLSKPAFNGLLKTLEEPPDHVKFLFATTEIDKVPVTVRSRCQRFDLRRIEAPVMVAHLSSICAREGVAIEPEALALIARAAEGSVRDALSLLDQAIAHGAGEDGAGKDGAGEGGSVDALSVRLMLGLADRGRIIDLFEAVMRGEVAVALNGLKALYDEGADPVGLLSALADFVHLVTRLKLVPEAAKDPSLTGEERERGSAFAARLGLPVLTRAWQLLAKGIGDVKEAPRPLAAADMVLVRLAHAADLPTPDEALRRLSALQNGGDAPRSAASDTGSAPPPVRGLAPAGEGLIRRSSGAATQSLLSARMAQPQPSGEARPLPRTMDDLVALAIENRDIQLKTAIERDIRPVRFEPGHVEFEAVPGASPQLAAHLMRRLNEWTGMRWMVAVAAQGGAPTLRERAEAQREARRQDLASHPVVSRILDLFPGSRIMEAREIASGPPPQEDLVPADDPPFQDSPPPEGGDDEIAYLQDVADPGMDDDL